MADRVTVILQPAEGEAARDAAWRSRMTLSAWIREAVLHRLVEGYDGQSP